MKTQKTWNLMYVAGNPKLFSKIIANASNPLKRTDALNAAKGLAEHGWRVWVEHTSTKVRIYESVAEIAHQQAKPVPDRALSCPNTGRQLAP